MPVNAIEIDSVTLRLGGKSILSDISLSVTDGEFIGVLGPNGAGKTTLMRTILGLLRPASGSVQVFGRPVSRGNPAIGYMPQNRRSAGLHLTGWDYVASTANGHRWGLPLLRPTTRDQVARAIQLVEAPRLARRPLQSLSGGERQRLLLAQALLGSPRLLLLDEPLISLDPTHQDAVVRLVRRVQQELQVTILFTAHELNPILPVVDRILYLGGGKAALGTVDEVITGPVLSRLYGSEIEVIRTHGRIFVMAGAHDVEGDAHRHEDHHRSHAHA